MPAKCANYQHLLIKPHFAPNTEVNCTCDVNRSGLGSRPKLVFGTSGTEAVGSAMSVCQFLLNVCKTSLSSKHTVFVICINSTPKQTITSKLSKVCTFFLSPSVTILKRNIDVTVETWSYIGVVTIPLL